MNEAEIREFDDRAGFELVSYREIALPIFLLTVDILVLEARPVPPVQEFVLRAVHGGLTDVQSVAGLLGVEDRVIVRGASALQGSDDLFLSAGHDGAHRLELTPKGVQTLEVLQTVRQIETTAPVMVDGLTRRVLPGTTRSVKAFPASEVGDRDLVEIPPHPRRKPRLVEIPGEEVMAVLNDEGARRRSQREVIGVLGVGRGRNFAREATALAYRSVDSDETQIAFVLDGELSDVHSASFAAAQRKAQRKVVPAAWKSLGEILGSQLDAATIEAAPSHETTRRIVLEQAAATRTRDELLVASTEGDRVESPELDAANERIAQLEAALARYSVRHLSVWEHREYLMKAIDESNERLLLISPWIRAAVVDDALVSRFRGAAQRGVQVMIGHGIGEDRKGNRSPKTVDRDLRAKGKLERLAEEFDNFRLREFGDTHAKVLVCDSRFVVITSFNWLSFKGDPQMKMRDERGMYVAIPEKIEQVVQEYLPRFG